LAKQELTGDVICDILNYMAFPIEVAVQFYKLYIKAVLAK